MMKLIPLLLFYLSASYLTAQTCPSAVEWNSSGRLVTRFASGSTDGSTLKDALVFPGPDNDRIAVKFDGVKLNGATNTAFTMDFLRSDVTGSGDILRLPTQDAADAGADFEGTVTFILRNDDPLTCTYTAGSLPIELTAFRARPVAKGVVLEWETASETDNHFVAVEKSRNGLEFSELKRIMGAGDAETTRTYKVMDDAPSSGTNYYRLRQVDYDGTTTFSDVITAHYSFGTERGLNVYPTYLTTGQPLQLDLRSLDAAMDHQLRIIGPTGAVIRTLSHPGGSVVPLSLGRLARGIYVVQGTDEVTRFIVQ